MNIPADVLEKLKCRKCGVYLSRGPVYLQLDGAALCGRCFTPDLLATRNTQYEAVAHLLRFPCKYSELGCSDTVPYVQEDEVIAHEEVCAYRQWVCPVLGSARCDWLGPRADFLRAFKLLFQLHIKICVTSAKMYHSVRHIGDIDSAFLYTFVVDIKRGEHLMSLPGDVTPQGCLANQEVTSRVTDINSLLAMLGGFAGTSITVEVKQQIDT